MGTDIESIIRNASKIKLPGGVVGKVSMLLLVAVAGIVALAWSVHIAWVAEGSILLIFLLVGGLGWRLINFADRNPQAALLEGAQFITHARLVNSQKGRDPVIIDVRELSAEGPEELAPAESAAALEPDPAPPRLPGKNH